MPRISRRPCRSRRCWAPTGCSPPTCRRCARRPGRRSVRRGSPPRWPARRSSPRTPGAMDNRVQDAYSLRCSPAVHGAARDTAAHASAGRRPGTGQLHRQSGRAARRPGRVQRQLPRRTDRRGAGFPGDLGRRRRRDRRAADRPDAGRVPIARPAAVPGPRGRRRLRPHDRPVHPGRDRLRTQAARRAGVGRLHPVVGDAGGPRVDGLARRPQAPPRRRRAAPGVGHRDPHRGQGVGPARAAAARARSPRRSGTRSARRVAGPGPDRHLGPEIDAVVDLLAAGAITVASSGRQPWPAPHSPPPPPPHHHRHDATATAAATSVDGNIR